MEKIYNNTATKGPDKLENTIEQDNGQQTYQQQQQQKSLTPQEQEEFSKLKSRQKYSEYYYFQKLLGQGAFCSVYQAVDNHTGETIAVKVIRRKNLNQNDVFLLRQEAEILKSMDHQNIVKFKHIREIGGRIFLGMELLKGGQLTELIKSKKEENKKFTDEEASTIMRQILHAVAYIHSIGIVHRDLKPGDFGLSAKYEHSSFITLDQHCGTLIFMAPEVALKKEYSKSVDIWSLGIIMYMLLTGGSHPLFSSKDSAESYKNKLKKINQLTFPSHLSVLAKNFFIRLTKFNIAQRYSAVEALQHPWITRINKTLIPLTLPDKMNHLELENKLRNKMSLMFFASIIKRTTTEPIRNNKEGCLGLKQHNYTDPDIQSYKRLLEKVTKKIDRWYDEKSRHHKEQFENDEEYIEHEQSPTHFDSSSDDEDDMSNMDLSAINKKFEGRESGFSNSNTSSSRKNKGGSIRTNPNSFKLSLLETNQQEDGKTRFNINNQIVQEDDEEIEFMQFLKNQDNQKKLKTGNSTTMQQQQYSRRKSLKKNSVAQSPPVRRDQQQQLVEKKKKSPNKINSSVNPVEGLLNFPLSGASTQTSNQPMMTNQNSNQDGSPPNMSLKLRNQQSNGNDQQVQNFGIKHPNNKESFNTQNNYQSVKHASSKIIEQSIDEQLKQQSYINSERVLQYQQSNQGDQKKLDSAYPQSSATFLNYNNKKNTLNLSHNTQGVDLSVYEINVADSSIQNNSFIHQKRNLKSLRAEDINNKKPSHKKSSTCNGANSLYHQSYPQQITTHQINLNDILKKNEGYDQKFLFKKNFIPKQKPVMISNHMLNQSTQQAQYYSAQATNALQSMNSTGIGSSFQINFKNSKKSGKKGNKSHSQGGSHAVNSNNNSTMNKKSHHSNMPMNYFTLSVDNNIAEDIRYKDQIQSNAQSHKFWNTNQHDNNYQHYTSQQNAKSSSSDLPLINTKHNIAYQSHFSTETQQNIVHMPLQKSKTGKTYEKNININSINGTLQQINNNTIYNGVFMGVANLLKEEDSIIVSYHSNNNNTQSINRPITSDNIQNTVLQSSFKHSHQLGSQKNSMHRSIMDNQIQQSFDQGQRIYYEQDQVNMIASQFQTPNMTKKQINAKLKGLELNSGVGKYDPQYSIKQNKNFQFSEDLVNNTLFKDIALANKSFDNEFKHNKPTSHQYIEGTSHSVQSHKRHKSMVNQQKPSQAVISYNNPEIMINNSLQTQKQFQQLNQYIQPNNGFNQTSYDADFQSKSSNNTPAIINKSYYQRASISSAQKSINSTNQNQLQQIIVQQIENSQNNNYKTQYGKQQYQQQHSTKTSINAAQFSQYQQNQSQMNNNQQQQKGQMPQHGIQGQQVILTDNYVNGQTNQIVKYKNKIIIRQH